MDKPYRVSLNTLEPLDLSNLAYQFGEGELKNRFSLSLDTSSILIITVASGYETLIHTAGFDYPIAEPLGEHNVVGAVIDAINLAKIFEMHSAKFNPNSLDLSLGHFQNDSVFETIVGPVAGVVQKRLYTGGDVYYSQSSHDYCVFLGTEEFASRIRGPIKPSKLIFPGTAQPANSLDGLLIRVEQNE